MSGASRSKHSTHARAQESDLGDPCLHNCPGSQLPVYARVGDNTVCAFNSLLLDLVESEQMPSSLWDYLGSMGVVLQETLVQ